MVFRDVGYARISKDDLRKGRGIARQTKDVQRVSEETGGQLVAMLSDNDLSASKYARKKRKDYPQLIEMARAGLVDRVIIYRLDRLLRIPDELEALIKLCEQRNVLVVNLNGSMNLTTAEGIKAARDRVADAAFESDLISERVRDSFDQLAEEGRPHAAMGKNRSFGYHDDGLTIRPDEADAIRPAAADALAGETLSEIARRWNAQGFRTPRTGSEWENRTVRAVLTGHRIAGLRVHRAGTKEEKVYKAAWPAIIDEATHRALRRRFLDQSARLPGRRTEFTGLFVTAAGRPMRRDRDRSRGVYRTYRRFPGEAFESVTIGPAAELEAFVAEMLFVVAESGEVAARMAARRAAKPTGEDPAVVEAELVQLAEDEASGLMTRAEWLAKRKRLVPRLRAAQAAEATAVANHALVAVESDLRARWAMPPEAGGYSVDRKRAIFAAVFDRIEIAPATRRGPGFDPSRVTPILRD